MGALVTDVRELGPTPNLMTQGGALCQNTAAHKTPQLQPQQKNYFLDALLISSCEWVSDSPFSASASTGLSELFFLL